VPTPSCRVLFIASAYPRHEGDVITPWLGATIAKLRDAGVHVEVLAPAFHGSPDHVVDGVRVHRFRYAPARWEMLSHDNPIPWQLRQRPLRLALIPGYIAASTLAATRLTSGHAFDVVHAFWPLPHAIPGIVARWIRRVPLVSTFFGAELHFLASRRAIARLAVRAIVQRSDAVTAISAFTARELVAIAPSAKPMVIPFGAALSPPAAVDDRPPFTEPPAHFLFVGRLVARKGVDVLLAAFARLLRGADAHLTIVGEGAEREHLEALTSSLDLRDRVTFTGYIPDDVLEALIDRCDALVLPAVPHGVAGTEGLGVVLIEALSHGKPVIASDTGGIPDVVQHERTGLLVPPGDVGALADAMRRFIDQPELARALGVAGRAHVDAKFSWPVIVEALVTLYDKVRAKRQ
jgi:glycosyltransferase involved in cell wall biosynthesis